MKIMTMNFRNGNFDDGVNSWVNREPVLLGILREHQPDIICAQECVRIQSDSILAAGLNYQLLTCERDDDEDSEMMAIFYNRSKFLLLASEVFWLSASPDVPGSSLAYAGCTRIAVVAKLFDRKTRQSFAVINTHLDHESAAARAFGSEVILARLPQNLPLILCGDFNEAPRNSAWNALTKTVFEDAADSVATVSGPDYSFHGYFAPHPPAPPEMIDWIMLSKNDFAVESIAVITNNNAGIYPSDHFPVCADVVMK
ncbi:MAG: endonuclease/exonuclease/phosphatase family protein [Bacillota bacterium]